MLSFYIMRLKEAIPHLAFTANKMSAIIFASLVLLQGCANSELLSSSGKPSINPDFDVHFNRATEYFVRANYLEAIDEYSLALELNPESVQAHTKRAHAYFITEQYRLAIIDYNYLVGVDPSDTFLLYQRSFSHYYENDFHQAILDATEVLRLDPTYDEALSHRGFVYLKMGNAELACSDFLSACDLGDCSMLESGNGRYCPADSKPQ